MPQIGVKAGQADRPRKRATRRHHPSSGGSAQRGFSSVSSFTGYVQRHPRRVTQPRPIQRAPRKRATRRHPSQSSQGFNAANALVREVRKHPKGYSPREVAGNRAGQGAFDLAGLLNRQLHSPQFDPHNFFINPNHKDAFQKFLGKNVAAPSLWVLNQTARPIHGIAGATQHGLKGFEQGFLHNKPYTFSDTLRKAGLPAGVASVGGFVADVGLDPTTYIAPEGKLARKGLEDQAAKALARGEKEKAARLLARAAKVPLDTKGISAGLRVHLPFTNVTKDLRTSGATSARVAGKTARVRRAVRETPPVQGTARRLAPDFREKGVTNTEHNAARQADVQHRSNQAISAQRADEVHRSLSKAAKTPGEQRDVIAAVERAPKPGTGRAVPFDKAATAKAIERHYRKLGKPVDRKLIARKVDRMAARAQAHHGTVLDPVRPSDLPGPLRNTAINVAKLNRDLAARERAAGINYHQRPFYFSHTRNAKVDKAEFDRLVQQQISPFRRGGRSTAGFSQGRSIPGTLDEIMQRAHAAGSKSPFTSDLPAAQASRVLESGLASDNAVYWRKLAQTGRRVHATPASLPDGYDAYVLTTKGLKPIERRSNGAIDRKEIGAAVRASKRGTGEVYVLNTRLIKPRLAAAEAKTRNLFDVFNSKWKYAVTQPFPSYHLGNLLGDSVLSFQGEGNVASALSAGRVLKGLHGERKALASPERFTTRNFKIPEGGAVKIGQQIVPIRQIIRDAEKHGVIPAGFASRELFDLAGQKVSRMRKFGEYREWLPRLTTYISAQRRGMSAVEAAKWTNQHHFDYGDLTPFEKQLRRYIIPFYTFQARNTRLQVGKLLTRPGKTATLEKAREESIKSQGVDPREFDRTMKLYEQRGAPFLVSFGGTLEKMFPRTPIEQGLGNIPMSVGDGMALVLNKTGPWKLPVELMNNFSLFFRQKIEDSTASNAGLRPAPPWFVTIANADPTGELKTLSKLQQAKNGQWYYRAKADYVIRSAIPGGTMLAQLGTNPAKKDTMHQQGTKETLLGLSSFKFSPWDRGQSKQVQDLYSQLDKIKAQQATMRKLGYAWDAQGQNAPNYQRLLDQGKRLQAQIDKIQPPTGGRPLTPHQKLLKKYGGSGDTKRLKQKYGGSAELDRLRAKYGQ